VQDNTVCVECPKYNLRVVIRLIDDGRRNVEGNRDVTDNLETGWNKDLVYRLPSTHHGILKLSSSKAFIIVLQDGDEYRCYQKERDAKPQSFISSELDTKEALINNQVNQSASSILTNLKDGNSAKILDVSSDGHSDGEVDTCVENTAENDESARFTDLVNILSLFTARASVETDDRDLPTEPFSSFNDPFTETAALVVSNDDLGINELDVVFPDDMKSIDGDIKPVISLNYTAVNTIECVVNDGSVTSVSSSQDVQQLYNSLNETKVYKINEQIDSNTTPARKNATKLQKVDSSEGTFLGSGYLYVAGNSTEGIANPEQSEQMEQDGTACSRKPENQMNKTSLAIKPVKGERRFGSKRKHKKINKCEKLVPVQLKRRANEITCGDDCDETEREEEGGVVAKRPRPVVDMVDGSRHVLDEYFTVRRRFDASGKKKRTFVCHMCNYLCAQRRDMIPHVRAHIGSRPFRCSVCEEAFSDKRYLESHMNNHIDRRPFLCNVCGKQFRGSQALRIHIRRHMGDLRHKCWYCERGFISNFEREQHIRLHHTNETPFLCDLCGEGYATNSYLKMHRLKYHNEINSVPFTVCQNCNTSDCDCGAPLKPVRVKRRKRKQEQQVVSIPPEEGELKQNKKWGCNLCNEGQNFDSAALLQRHIRVRHKGLFKCLYCGEVFDSKQIRSKHVQQSHDDEKKFECNTCSKRFFNVTTLDAHKLVHDKDSKPHACGECGKRFSLKCNLVAHEQLHEGKRFYECQKCRKVMEVPFTLGVRSSSATFTTHECNSCGGDIRLVRNPTVIKGLLGKE